jgi:hypothetical protein
MKNLRKYIAPIALLFAICGTCGAGPSVVIHPNSAGVTIRDSKFEVVQYLKDPKRVKFIQNAFFRAKRVGNTTAKLKTPTHNIDVSDRWLIDIHSGEFGLLTKSVTDVYRLDSKDLATIKGLLEFKAEQGAAESER